MNHKEIIQALIEVSRAAFDLLDNSEERGPADSSEHVVQAADVATLSHTLDKLDELPDDKPGYVLSGPAKAEWALSKEVPQMVTLTGSQLKEAFEFLCPSWQGPGMADPGDEYELEGELTFGVVSHKADDGTVSKGMCCWNEDTDGVLPLHEELVINTKNPDQHEPGCHLGHVPKEFSSCGCFAHKEKKHTTLNVTEACALAGVGVLQANSIVRILQGKFTPEELDMLAKVQAKIGG